MKFQIRRTSLTLDEQPCEESFKGKLTSVDTRTVDDPSKLICMNAQNWYGVGSNHRVVNGHIKRDLEKRDVWFIKINTIKELMELQKKYGDIIITNSYIDGNTPMIEIDDDY